VLFPQVYQRGTIAPGAVVLVKGRVEIDEGEPKIVADAVRRISAEPLVIRLGDERELERVKAIIAGKRGGRPVVLEVVGARTLARLVLPPVHWVDEDSRVVQELAESGI